MVHHSFMSFCLESEGLIGNCAIEMNLPLFEKSGSSILFPILSLDYRQVSLNNLQDVELSSMRNNCDVVWQR